MSADSYQLLLFFLNGEINKQEQIFYFVRFTLILHVLTQVSVVTDSLLESTSDLVIKIKSDLWLMTQRQHVLVKMLL